MKRNYKKHGGGFGKNEWNNSPIKERRLAFAKLGGTPWREGFVQKDAIREEPPKQVGAKSQLRFS